MSSPAREKHLIRAYGDRRDDGIIQISFTLPVATSEKAKEAAQIYCKKLGLTDVKVAAAERAACRDLRLIDAAAAPRRADLAASTDDTVITGRRFVQTAGQRQQHDDARHQPTREHQ